MKSNRLLASARRFTRLVIERGNRPPVAANSGEQTNNRPITLAGVVGSGPRPRPPRPRRS